MSAINSGFKCDWKDPKHSYKKKQEIDFNKKKKNMYR